ncbi:unnamed protein product [Candida verbasci]|uniref:Rgp1-domain-containing protein n=1 Tax=Candida verbasci TaxID=1227364 RepID=A0A9W4TQV6_9ASCO|nr:unnamed protein product [Candida verbasci]
MSNDSYTKTLNESLKVSLTYEKSIDQFQNCLLTFQNTSTRNIIVNPTKESESSWFNIFGSKAEESLSKLHIQDDDQSLKLFLGKIQLFGYIVLNYSFNTDTSSLELTKQSQWWNNHEYLTQYFHKDDPDKDESDNQWKMDLVKFIDENQENKLIINGKLGGVNELIIDNNEQKTTNNVYLLNDLISNFNSKSKPKTEVEVSLQDVIDSILPIYTTPQCLLFTDLIIPKNSQRQFKFKFPINNKLPPSYNTRSTGSACDQGWISIRYSLIISLIEDKVTNQSKSIYFPYNVIPKRYGVHKYYQRNFLTEPIALDKHWKIEENEGINGVASDIDPDSNKEAFLQDLSTLIESDLYNMPKISTNERRKSSVKNGFDEEFDQQLYKSQLPQHLKTQYQLRVNNHELCIIAISKPYFHLGEDINFIIDINSLNRVSTKNVGIISYIEAYEIYHLNNDSQYINPYKVTSNIKINSFSSSILNKEKVLINDYINIPKFLSSQFQSENLMDLKYFLIFQFNLIEDLNEDEDLKNDVTELNEEEIQLNNGTKADDNYDKVTKYLESNNVIYKFDKVGSTYKFKIPLYILP